MVKYLALFVLTVFLLGCDQGPKDGKYVREDFVTIDTSNKAAFGRLLGKAAQALTSQLTLSQTIYVKNDKIVTHRMMRNMELPIQRDNDQYYILLPVIDDTIEVSFVKENDNLIFDFQDELLEYTLVEE